MRSLRWVGVLGSLLIVGVLGGLIAPLPSEAVPTLTLQVDSGTPVNILGAATTCSSTSYNQCYTINTTIQALGNNGRFYKASAAPGGLQPRLNVWDGFGSDAFKLTGVLLGPTSTTWPTNEVHVLKIVMTNTFNLAPNPAGAFSFALRTGGYLSAGPIPIVPNVTQYDFLKFEGKGTFSSTLVNVPLLNAGNPVPLQLQVLNAVAKTYFTLSQIPPAPTFSCNNGSGKCTPTITLTYTVTFYGPDSLALTDSNDAIGGSCNLTSPDPDGGPSGNTAIPCHSSGRKKSLGGDIAEAFIQLDAADVTAAVADGAVAAIACVVDCPCADPDTCKGTIVTMVKVTPATAVNNLNFTTVGDFGDDGINPSFIINSDRKGLGSSTLNEILPVGGGPWIIAQGAFPQIDANTSWDTDQIDCVSQLNTDTATFTTFTVGSGPNGEKGPVTVDKLGGGDTLTCTWYVHKNNSGN